MIKATKIAMLKTLGESAPDVGNMLSIKSLPDRNSP